MENNTNVAGAAKIAEMVNDGQAAIVPLSWLSSMLGGAKTRQLLGNRRQRRAVRKARGKQAGVYKPYSNPQHPERNTVRGRENLKKIYAVVRQSSATGVTASQIADTLKMDVASVRSALARLQHRRAVHYIRNAA